MERKPANEELDVIDVTSLSLDEIDSEQNLAIFSAVQAVLRKQQLPQTHQDHGSHSNSNA